MKKADLVGGLKPLNGRSSSHRVPSFTSKHHCNRAHLGVLTFRMTRSRQAKGLRTLLTNSYLPFISHSQKTSVCPVSHYCPSSIMLYVHLMQVQSSIRHTCSPTQAHNVLLNQPMLLFVECRFKVLCSIASLPVELLQALT